MLAGQMVKYTPKLLALLPKYVSDRCGDKVGTVSHAPHNDYILVRWKQPDGIVTESWENKVNIQRINPYKD